MRRALAVIGIAVTVAVAVAAWLFLRPRKTLAETRPASSDFDRAFTLPGSPQGLATDGRELIAGNRKDPWGLMRLHRHGDEGFRGEVIPLLETVYKQKMDIQTIVWNGKNYVGYTSAAWFSRSTDQVFTIHDRDTLQAIRHLPAPPLLGCLAWDGKGYWAATRKNTVDAKEEAYLYRLDPEFNVISKTTPPSVGCQGMAWDRKHLWIADVFDDAIYVLDVSHPEPRVVSKTTVNVSYLSGLAFFEGQIWLTDYDKDRLQRLSPKERIAWKGGVAPETPSVKAAVLAGAMATPETKLVASHKNSFAKFRLDDMEIVEWSIEIRDNVLRGSWRFWYGGDLFTRGELTQTMVTLPQFAKYTLTITSPDGTEVEKEFDAFPGENATHDVELAPASAPGEYDVSVFMHVQYVTASGEAKILNNSAGSLTVKK